MASSTAARARSLSDWLQIRPAVVDQVEQQIRVFLDACAKQDSLTPTGCPFQVDDIVIGEAGVHWSIDKQPVIEIVPADNPSPGDPSATVRTVTPGRAAVTYTAFTFAGGDRSTITRQEPIAITGTVAVDPAQPCRVVWNG